jgi:hypothetical protein
MPTSSERLYIRAYAYQEASNHMSKWADMVEREQAAEEYERLAKRFMDEYHRLWKLADTRKEKEQGHEHRRTRK